MIPAYMPDEKFIQFLQELLPTGCTVVSVDDGSGEACRAFFSAAEGMGVHVVAHAQNRGKGVALKTGIAYILEHFPKNKGVITADCDGQHTVEDILRVADAMDTYPDTLILGGRFCENEKIPFRSALGNGLTRGIFRIATGMKVRDTQTGLRGLPAKILPDLLKIKGDRYEYEMNMLLKIKEWGLSYKEIPIQTIYIDNNRASHYNTFRDSWRIFKQIVKFCASSIACFALDYVLFILFFQLFEGLWGEHAAGIATASIAYLCARIISALANYAVNSRFVFRNAGKRTLLRYALLAFVIAAIGSYGTQFLTDIAGFSSVLCKLIVDVPLFLLSYFMQREFVFKRKAPRK